MILGLKAGELAWKVARVVGPGVLIALACVVLWRHYTGLVDAKADLTAKVATLETDLAGEKARNKALAEAISDWERAATAQASALSSLAQAQARSAAASRELKHVLSKHDLGALALAKPALVESRINAGTERAMRLLERASEVSATDGDAPTTSTSTTSAHTPQP